MGRTAWWKKRHSRSNSAGADTLLQSSPLDTSYSARVKVERVPSESSEGSSPSLRTLRSDLSDSTKGDDELITSTKKIDESVETPERKHVDECIDHPVPPVMGNGSNHTHVSSEKSSEAEAEEYQTSLGDDGEQSYADVEEVPDIARTDTEESGEGSVDSSAADTQGSSAQATIAVSVMTSKTDNTDYTDDGILRDDEGNPVDLAEAEENMLRDDEGNIIDPKTLVTRDLDLCEDYCEELMHAIGADGALNESEIDEDTYVRFTIEAVVSEMVTLIETHHDQSNLNDEICTEEDDTEPLKEGCNNEASAIDEADEDEDEHQSEAYDNVQPTLGRGARPRRNCNASGRNRSRQIRWGRASPQQGADDTVHIMFNNTLSTLDEEASGIIDEESVEDTEDEKSNISHKSTRSEKFFKARWNYSLQVMKSEASTEKLIDARDEIDDMIRPKFLDDRSVCSDEGTI